jgi:hypothetical protein
VLHPIAAGLPKPKASVDGWPKVETAITSETRITCGVFRSGASVIRATGKSPNSCLKRVKLLIPSRLTPISDLVTQPETNPVRYKISVLPNILRFLGLSPW